MIDASELTHEEREKLTRLIESGYESFTESEVVLSSSGKKTPTSQVGDELRLTIDKAKNTNAAINIRNEGMRLGHIALNIKPWDTRG